MTLEWLVRPNSYRYNHSITVDKYRKAENAQTAVVCAGLSPLVRLSMNRQARWTSVTSVVTTRWLCSIQRFAGLDVPIVFIKFDSGVHGTWHRIF